MGGNSQSQFSDLELGSKTYVDDVVPPSDVVEGDGVDVGVDEEGGVDGEPDDAHALGADVVRQDLDGVADQQAGPGHVVADVVQEDHEDDGVAHLVVGAALNVEAGGADGPDDEAKHHAEGRAEEELAAANLVDEEAEADGDDGVADLQHAVDDQLEVAVFDADAIEHRKHVVRDQAVARPLRKQTESSENDHTAAVPLRPNELKPAVAFEFFLDCQSVLDFLEFDLNDLVVDYKMESVSLDI